MTTHFSEDKIVRDADGKFAPGVTGATELDLDDASEADVWGEIDPQEVLSIAKTTAYWLAQSKGLDPEDLAADTVVATLTAISRQGGKAPDNLRAFTRTRAHGLAVQKVFGTSRGQDISAFSQFIEKRNALEEEMSRSLSQRELDDLAEKIRSAQQPGKRATEGYHKRGGTAVSIDAMSEDLGVSFRNGLDDVLPDNYGHQSQHFKQGSVGDQVEDLTQDGDRRAAKLAVWDVIADADDVITTRPNTGTTASRREAAAAMSGSGTNEAVTAILNESATASQREQFASPWSGASDRQVRDVARSLQARPAYAADLWSAAHASSVSKSKSGGSNNAASVLPDSTRKNVMPARVDAARAAIIARGGASTVASRYLSGELDDRSASALLMPWGGSSASSKTAREVAHQLASSADADTVWNGALETCSR